MPIDETNPEALLQAAQLAEKAGKKEDAARALEAAHNLLPDDHALALRLAKLLAGMGQHRRAAELLEPFAAQENPEYNRALAEAHLANGNLLRAEEVFWTLSAVWPEAYSRLLRLVGTYIQARKPQEAAALTDKLKLAMLAGEREQEFISFIQEIGKTDPLPVEMMEALATAYEELTLDKLCGAMRLRLFDGYAIAGQFSKAAGTFDRILAQDPENAQNPLRLQLLKGKIDRGRYDALAAKLPAGLAAASGIPALQAAPTAAPAVARAESEEISDVDKSNVLEDLMLQAEIFLQYGLKPRALERVERIARQFPGEEAHNEKLRSLYGAVQFTPSANAGASAATARVATAPVPEDDLRGDITRVAEITRAIYRQASVKEVLSTSVNEIGRAWRISRCVAGLCTPGKPPSAAVEYCAPGMTQSDVKSIVKLVITLVGLTTDGNPLAVEDVASLPKLAPLSSVFQALNMKSLLALPLMEADQPIGVLILEQCDRMRRWRSSEIVALKSIADQIVITSAHVKLRSLMKSLSLSEDQSGLLSRDSYLTCLLNECGRAVKQNAALSVMLLQFGPRPSGYLPQREQVDEALETYIRDAVQLIAGHFRQNDIAVRYDPTTVALVMPDTKGKDTFFVVDKFRRMIGALKPASGDAPPPLTIGIAEALSNGNTDVVDNVTELINRVEDALDAAHEDGGATSKLLMPPAI